MIVKLIGILLLSIAGGKLYRMGGKGKPYNTKHRDFGVAILGMLAMILLGVSVPWWVHLIAFTLMFGSLTTYWDYWGTDDIEWYEWLMTGFMYGMAAIPYAWASGMWMGFIARTIVLTVLTCLWSQMVDDVEWEERGRGFLFIATMPLFLV